MLADFIWRVDKNSSNHNTMASKVVKQVILCCTGDILYYGMTLEFICVLSQLELINSNSSKLELLGLKDFNNMNQSNGQKKIDK